MKVEEGGRGMDWGNSESETRIALPGPWQEKVGEEVKVEEGEMGMDWEKAEWLPRSHQTGSASFRS